MKCEGHHHLSPESHVLSYCSSLAAGQDQGIGLRGCTLASSVLILSTLLSPGIPWAPSQGHPGQAPSNQSLAKAACLCTYGRGPGHLCLSEGLCGALRCLEHPSPLCPQWLGAAWGRGARHPLAATSRRWAEGEAGKGPSQHPEPSCAPSRSVVLTLGSGS